MKNILIIYYLKYNNRNNIITITINDKTLNVCIINDKLFEYKYNNYQINNKEITFDDNYIKENNLKINDLCLRIEEGSLFSDKNHNKVCEFKDENNKDIFGQIYIDVRYYKKNPFKFQNYIIINPNNIDSYISIATEKYINKHLLDVKIDYNSFNVKDKYLINYYKKVNCHIIKSISYKYSINYNIKSLYSSKNTPFKFLLVDLDLKVSNKFKNPFINIQSCGSIIIEYSL